MSRVARGRLVVFEGGEGAGKSTQLRRLSAALTATGVAHQVFREPGGTAAGDRIRELLLHGAEPLDPRTEAALFMASRAQLVAEKVKPALERGEHVLLDRFLLSSYAYQAKGRDLPIREVARANALATDGLVPDLTILLTIDPVEGLIRVKSRGSADRIEGADEDFHWRVAKAFKRFAESDWQEKHAECGPIEAVDAVGSEEDVEARVQRVLAARLPEVLAAGTRS